MAPPPSPVMGLTMFFTVCNTKYNKTGCSIFTSRYNPIKKQWGKPQLVESIAGKKEVIVNSRGKTKQMPTDDRQPMVSRDGRTLFFVSDRGDGEGGFDIWFSRRLGTGWSQPVNAGPNVNTPFNEYSPFLSEDGNKLFFASNGRGGFGGLDLYKAVGSIGDWTEAENMGLPSIPVTMTSVPLSWTTTPPSSLPPTDPAELVATTSTGAVLCLLTEAPSTFRYMAWCGTRKPSFLSLLPPLPFTK